MLRKISLLLLLAMTLFTTSLTYAEELSLEESRIGILKNLLGNRVVEDAITRQLAFEKEDEDYIIYTVKEGDNLFRIAYNHSVPLDLLMEWNDLDDTLIHPGKELIIKTDGKYKKNINRFPLWLTPLNKSLQKRKNTANHDAAQQVVASVEPASSGKELMVTATAYTAYCKGCSGTTAYGINLRENPHLKVIAVDPNVIPLGTRVWVEGYGYAIAGDTGGAIKGNKIDVFIPSYDEAMQWGVKKVKVKILD